MDLKYKSKQYILQWNVVMKMERIDVEKTNPLTSGVFQTQRFPIYKLKTGHLYPFLRCELSVVINEVDDFIK